MCLFTCTPAINQIYSEKAGLSTNHYNIYLKAFLFIFLLKLSCLLYKKNGKFCYSLLNDIPILSKEQRIYVGCRYHIWNRIEINPVGSILDYAIISKTILFKVVSLVTTCFLYKKQLLTTCSLAIMGKTKLMEHLFLCSCSQFKCFSLSPWCIACYIYLLF